MEPETLRCAIDRVAAYYAMIDANDIDGVVSLFTPDAAYDRAGRTYEGKAAVEDFFRNKRQIRGEHRIEGIWRLDETDMVLSVGTFIGEGAAKDPRSVVFTDIWSFDATLHIERRRTFLAMGHDYVER